jgi:hypothetical protein
MVEKGDQGPDETPTSSFTDTSPIERFSGVNLTVDTTGDDESDEDESEDEEDEASRTTADTELVSEFKAIGLGLYDHTRCMVELSQKVKGHHLYCGHLRHSCPRPKHRVFQEIPGKAGPPGVYQQLPNAKNTCFDAVADTLTSIEDLKAQRQANRANLEKIGASKSKAASEIAAKPKELPVVRIDSTPRCPRASQISGWSKHLLLTPDRVKQSNVAPVIGPPVVVQPTTTLEEAC